MSLKENQSKNPEFVMLSKEFLVVMQRNQNKNERTSLLDDFNATQLQKNAVSVAWGSAALALGYLTTIFYPQLGLKTALPRPNSVGPSIATTGAYPKFLKSAFASTSCLPLLNSNGFNKTCSQTGNPLPDIGTSVFSPDIGTSVFSPDIGTSVVSPDLDKPVGSPNTLKSKPCLEVTIAQKMPCIFTNS
jgi:hypothetical protein